MNHFTTYEQLVADKLQQLPVPDMADAIWARIEQQLDVEMPVDKSGDLSNGNNSLPGFRFPGNIILYVFLAALISVVFYLNRSGQYKETLVQPTSNTISVPASEGDLPQKLSRPGKQAETNYTDKTDLPVEVKEEKAAIENEPSEIANKTPDIKELEPLKKEEPPPLIEMVQKKAGHLVQDSVPKKTRGVKGITPNDYRIAPVRKDSL